MRLIDRTDPVSRVNGLTSPSSMPAKKSTIYTATAAGKSWMLPASTLTPTPTPCTTTWCAGTMATSKPSTNER